MGLVVFFDTNILGRINLSANADLARIVQHAQTYGVQLSVNRVVYLEMQHQKDREVRFVRKFIQAWRSVIQRQGSAAAEDLELRSFDVHDDLKKPLEEAGITILDNEVQDIAVGIQAMYQGLKPAKKQADDTWNIKRELDEPLTNPDYLDFKYQENGIKDVFIWQCVVALVRQQPLTEVVFLSNNSKDFCEERTTELHPQLKTAFEGPEHGNIKLIASMGEFNTQHIDFIEGFGVRAVDVLGASNYPELLPSDGTARDLVILGVDSTQIVEVSGYCRFKANLKVRFEEEDQEAGDDPLGEDDPLLREVVKKLVVEVERAAPGSEAEAYRITGMAFV